MEDVVLVKTEVHFHGIWKAGYKVTDNLIKSIGTDVSAKPSRPCTLQLTSRGLTLELLPSQDGRSRKTNQLSFDSLRDISVNSYQPKCLIIIYVDSSGKFSVMAYSTHNEQDIQEISKAYKNQKNVQLLNLRTETHAEQSINWSFRKRQTVPTNEFNAIVKDGLVKLNYSNDVAPNHAIVSPAGSVSFQQKYGSSQTSNASVRDRLVSESEENYDQVFLDSRPVVVHEHEDVAREPVGETLQGQHVAFNVQIQTAPYEEDDDSQSITSASTVQSSQIDVLAAYDDGGANMSPNEKCEEISAEVFLNRRDSQGTRHTNEINNFPKPQDDITTKSSLNDCTESGSHGMHPNTAMEPSFFLANASPDGDWTTGQNSFYDLRCIGTQTINSSKISRRYTKKQISRTIYKSHLGKTAAIRKRSSSVGPTSPSSEVVEPAAPSPRASVVPTTSRASVVPTTSRAMALPITSRSSAEPTTSRPSAVPTTSRPSAVPIISRLLVVPTSPRAWVVPTSPQASAVPTRQRSSGAGIGQVSSMTQPVKRPLSFHGSTVIKPIEQVYNGPLIRRSNSARSRRPMVVYSPTMPGRMF